MLLYKMPFIMLFCRCGLFICLICMILLNFNHHNHRCYEQTIVRRLSSTKCVCVESLSVRSVKIRLKILKLMSIIHIPGVGQNGKKFLMPFDVINKYSCYLKAITAICDEWMERRLARHQII